MRNLLFTLHKYTGLITGLLLVVIGLSGSLLVFHEGLDESLNPQLMTQGKNTLPLNDIVANAEAELGRKALRIEPAQAPGSPHTLRFFAPPGEPGPIQVSVSPYTGEVLAIRTWGDYLMTWIYSLHYTLLSGEIGEIVVGVLGLCLLGFCLTGVYLWWPTGKRKGKWRRNLTIKRGAGTYRLHFDLHQVIGIYFLPVLLVVAFSGVTLIFPTQVAALVDTVLPLEKLPSPSSTLPDTPGAPSLSPQQSLDIARTVFPQAPLIRLDFPRNETGSYSLAFNRDGEPWQHYGASRIWVDQYSGEVLAVWDAPNVAAGSQFMTWQFPLHNGDALGMPGRIIVLISGLTPLLFFITGTYMWWQKRLLRLQAQRRKLARQQAH